MDLIKLIEDYPWLLIISISILIALFNWKSNFKTNRVKDQKSAIIELINEIQQSTFTLTFGQYEILENNGGIGGANGHGHLTLFKISKYNLEIDNSSYEDTPVYFELGSNLIFDFRKYSLNPILPKDLKNIMKKFHNTTYSLFNKDQTPGIFDYVSLDSGKIVDSPPFFRIKDDTKFKLGNGIAYQSYLSFSTCCAELENSIINWSRNNKAGLTIENDFDI